MSDQKTTGTMCKLFSNRHVLKNKRIALLLVLLCGINSAIQMHAEDKLAMTSDNQLLNDYIATKGACIIVFDAQNIKQFWTGKNVVSRGDRFEIYSDMKDMSSPLKFQLINVDETQDCNVEIITDTPNIDFNVINSKSSVISKSSSKDNFLQYYISSSTFHLEDTTNTTFSLKFISQADPISIRKIILSFSENKKSSFLKSPGVLNVSEGNLIFLRKGSTEKVSEKAFLFTSQNGGIFSDNKILCEDNTLKTTVTIKNVGQHPTHVYIGFRPYNKAGESINHPNYPYNNINKTLCVLSISKDNSSIKVDSYPEWKKGCYIALNAKDDLSDIPNTSVVLESRIDEIRKLENGHAMIILDNPLKTNIKIGEKIRINNFGGGLIYMNSKTLQPGEEETFTSNIKKDNNYLEYSTKAFSRGIYYAVPMVIVSSEEENTILISDFSVSF